MSNLPILNPTTGTQSFGVVPALNLGGLRLLDAEIRLFQGRHIGPNRGFGARHIWAEHRLEMTRVGWATEVEVAQFVLTIIRTGTPLIFEGASWSVTRLLAVRASRGTAILEFRDQRDGPIWSVVTAFAGTKTHGTRVGTVR